MDSVSSSSSDEECDSRGGLISDPPLPHLPPPYWFLQPSSTTGQPLFDDSIMSKFLHPIPASVQPHHLPVDDSVYLSSQNLMASHPDHSLDSLMMNSAPSARPLLFADPSGSIFRDPAPPLVMENARQDPVDSVLMTAQSNKSGSKPAATGRNRKKRTRASRRAPTTVMTTDTANFRAMVQEFTGVPATSLLPSHLHRAGIGFLGPGKVGFGTNKWEQQLPYSRMLRPFAPKTKSAMFNDHSLSPQLALPSDFGLFNFQSFAQLQSPTDPMIGSKSQNGAGGECTTETLNHPARTVDFHEDQAGQSDVNTRT